VTSELGATGLSASDDPLGLTAQTGDPSSSARSGMSEASIWILAIVPSIRGGGRLGSVKFGYPCLMSNALEEDVSEHPDRFWFRVRRCNFADHCFELPPVRSENIRVDFFLDSGISSDIRDPFLESRT